MKTAAEVSERITKLLGKLDSVLYNVEDDSVANEIEDISSKIYDELDELEDDEFGIPHNLSLGEAISLKETINAWRKEHGYGEVS